MGTATGGADAPQDDTTAAELVRAFSAMQVRHAHLVQVVADRHGLNPADVRVLKFLGAEAGPATPTALAAHMLMSTGTVTAVLDRLERRGVLARERNPDDGRSVLVGLRPSGTAVVRALEECYRRALLDAVPRGDRAALTEVVRGLAFGDPD